MKTRCKSIVKARIKQVWKRATALWIYTKLCMRKPIRLVQRKRKIVASLAFIAASVVSIWLVIDFWNWLASIPDKGERESYSTTLRNVGLLFGGALALLLGFWRGWAADRQAKIAQENVLDQRYQKGIESLGSTTLSERLGASTSYNA